MLYSPDISPRNAVQAAPTMPGIAGGWHSQSASRTRLPHFSDCPCPGCVDSLVEFDPVSQYPVLLLVLYVSHDLRLPKKISSENFVRYTDGKRSARPFHRCKVHVQQSSFRLHFDSSLFALLPYCCTRDTRMWVKNRVLSQDGASPGFSSRRLLNTNSSARTS